MWNQNRKIKSEMFCIFLYPVLEVLCIFYTRACLTSDQPGLGGQPGSNLLGFGLCAGSLGTAHTRRAHREADGRCLAGYVPSGGCFPDVQPSGMGVRGVFQSGFGSPDFLLEGWQCGLSVYEDSVQIGTLRPLIVNFNPSQTSLS